MPALTANDIWRDFETAGVPASGAHKPVKADIRAWGTALEAVGGFNVPGTDTTAALFSAGAGAAPVWRKIVGFDLPNPSTTTPGAVFAKPTVAGQVLTGLGADGEFETGAFTANNPNFTGTDISLNGLKIVGVSGGTHVLFAPDGHSAIVAANASNSYRATTHNFQPAAGGTFATWNDKTLTLLPTALTGAASDPAISLLQTWNTTATFDGVILRFIQTAQGPTSRALRIRGGTDGLKDLFTITIGDPTNPAMNMNGRTVFAAPDGNANFIYSTANGLSYINAAGGNFLTLIANNGVWSFMGTTSGSHAVSAAAVASGASTFPNTSGELFNTGLGAPLAVQGTAVDFNVVGDNPINIKMPTGVTRYRVGAVLIVNTGPGAASLNVAQIGVYTGPGGTGTNIVAPAALNPITSNSPSTAASVLQMVGTLFATMYFDIATTPTIYIRVTTAQGAAAVGRAYLQMQPVG